MSKPNLASFIQTVVETFVSAPASESREKLFGFATNINPFSFFQPRVLEDIKNVLEKDDALHAYLLELTTRIALSPYYKERLELLSVDSVTEEFLEFAKEFYRSPKETEFHVNRTYQTRTEYGEKYKEAVSGNFWLIVLFVICAHADNIAKNMSAPQK